VKSEVSFEKMLIESNALKFIYILGPLHVIIFSTHNVVMTNLNQQKLA